MTVADIPPEKKKTVIEKVIDRSVDFIFSKDNRKWVLLLFLIGFILRALSALRLKFDADEMIYVPQAMGFMEAAKLQNYNQCALWYWLTDFFSNIFGANAFGVRFLSILLGSLSIILIYLLGKKLFNDKVGLIAAFIFTFSPFQLVHLIGEMDIPMSFFAFFSMYLLISSIDSGKKSLFYLSWVSLGIAIMMKPIALLFIPAFAFSYILYNKKHKNNLAIKPLFYAALLIILMVLPVLTYNYLLYQDKNLVDLQFSRFTKIGFQQYADIASTIEPFSLKVLFYPGGGQLPGFLQGFQFIFKWGLPLTFILALIGAFYFYKEKNKFFLLLILSFLIPFIFLAGTSLLSTHFIFVDYFVSLLAAIAIVNLTNKFKREDYAKFFVYSLIILILILSLAKIQYSSYMHGFFGANELDKLISFKDKSIEKNSLVIVDSRIYRGRIAFMFWDRHYLESAYFSSLISEEDKFSGEYIPITTYFIEAVQDDSGWGTVKNQPDFNASMEKVVSIFSKSAELTNTIYGIDGNPQFNIYKKIFSLKSSVLQYADSTHVWFYYPLGYKPVDDNFDHYEIYNTSGVLLNRIAFAVLYIELALFFLALIYIFYLLFKK